MVKQTNLTRPLLSLEVFKIQESKVICRLTGLYSFSICCTPELHFWYRGKFLTFTNTNINFPTRAWHLKRLFILQVFTDLQFHLFPNIITLLFDVMILVR